MDTKKVIDRVEPESATGRLLFGILLLGFGALLLRRSKKGMSGWALIGSLVSSGVIMLVQSIFELRKAESAAGD